MSVFKLLLRFVGRNKGMCIYVCVFMCVHLSTQGPPGERGERGEPGDDGYQVDKIIKSMSDILHCLVYTLLCAQLNSALLR